MGCTRSLWVAFYYLLLIVLFFIKTECVHGSYRMDVEIGDDTVLE
jgi:hypothetical protein